MNNGRKNIVQRKKNILLYADFGCTTGFGNLAKELINRMKFDFTKCNVHIFALNNFRPSIYKYDGMTVHPAHLFCLQKTDPYYRNALLTFLIDYKVDVLWMINDIELAATLEPHFRNVQAQKKKTNQPFFKSIFYFPVDSIPYQPNLKCLSFFDEIITYTQYGKNVISELADAKTTNRLKVITHGVDTATFRKLDNQQELREEFFPGAKFIIGSVNRNSARKDVSTLILAFAKFLKQIDNRDAVLYLHMNPTDPAGPNLIKVCEAQNLEVGKDVVFPDKFNENEGWDTESLNLMYNCMDVFITTTTAEGWGLTVTEAMSANTLVMAPMHTSLKEIIGEGRNAIAIRDLDDVVFCNDGNKVRYKTNTSQLAFMITNLYNLKMFYPDKFDTDSQPYIDSAADFVNTIPWKRIAAQFTSIINKYI